ncbi:MAG: hypothetical protein GKS06_17500 [Acidobacteria bacterium]|nr:hypothetical protein [Acidobacteriota bacterium]
MQGMTPSRLTFLAPAIVCLAVALVMGLQLTRQMREDLYWTPAADAPGLADARARAEVLVEGELFEELIEAGRVRVDGRPMGSDQVQVRFNNIDTVTRAQMIILAAATGAGVAMLIAAMLLPARERRRRVVDEDPPG